MNPSREQPARRKSVARPASRPASRSRPEGPAEPILEKKVKRWKRHLDEVRALCIVDDIRHKGLMVRSEPVEGRALCGLCKALTERKVCAPILSPAGSSARARERRGSWSDLPAQSVSQS
jgi:hypothetical protein